MQRRDRRSPVPGSPSSPGKRCTRSITPKHRNRRLQWRRSSDVHSGPFWWEGPTFDRRHQFFPPPPNNAYTDQTLGDWADYEYDVDKDGLARQHQRDAAGNAELLYKNPGKPMIDADTSVWAKSELGHARARAVDVR